MTNFSQTIDTNPTGTTHPSSLLILGPPNYVTFHMSEKQLSRYDESDPPVLETGIEGLGSIE